MYAKTKNVLFDISLTIVEEYNQQKKTPRLEQRKFSSEFQTRV